VSTTSSGARVDSLRPSGAGRSLSSKEITGCSPKSGVVAKDADGILSLPRLKLLKCAIERDESREPDIAIRAKN
jgi:hypothetical protein